MTPEIQELTQYLKQSAPVLVPLLLYFLRNETRLARIETHIQWIKKTLEVQSSQPNSEKHTQENGGANRPTC